ncbi:MAG: lysophospholipid acyltransferase family protein [Limnochordia bacterium]
MIYSFCRWLFRVFFRLFYRYEVIGREKVPAQGGAIIIANHISWLDPPLLAAVLDRPVAFMAKEELFRWPLAGWFFRQLNAFPVQRGEGDRRALRTAYQILGEGGVLGLFPEGTRGSGSLQPFHRGAALIALRTGVPVVPVALWGTNRKPGAQARVRIGEPVVVTKEGKVARDQVEQLTNQLEERVGALLDQLQ